MSDETKPAGDQLSGTTESSDPQLDQAAPKPPTPQGAETGGTNQGPHQEQGGMRS